MSVRERVFQGTLLAKTLANFTIWGSMLLFAPASLLEVLGLPNSIYLRFCGFAGIMLALCFWQGYKDPGRNFGVVKIIALDCVLFTLLVLYFHLTSVIPWILKASAALTFIFTILLVWSGGTQFLRRCCVYGS